MYYEVEEPEILSILNEPDAKPVKTGKFIDIKTDFGFKKIFGAEPNKEMLIDLLNQLFHGEKKIVDLTYHNTEQIGSLPESRSAVFDIRCRDVDGEAFIVEMQRANQEHFLKRILFYTSRLIDRLGKPGREWAYNLPGVYFVGILDFNYQTQNPNKYRHHYKLRDDDPDHSVLLEDYGVILVELPKFRMELEALKTNLEKWCYLFKNFDKMDQIPVSLSEGVLKELFPIARVSNLSKMEYTMYQHDLQAQQDEYAVLENARKEGREEEALRARKEAENTIRNLLTATELSISEISKITGWDEQSIQKIKDSME